YQPASWQVFGRINLQALMGHPFVRPSKLPGTAAVIVGLAVILVAAIAAVVRARRGRIRPALSSPLTLLAILTLATPIGVGIASLRPHESFMLSRNEIASLVPAAVLLGWLLTAMPRRAAVPAVAAYLAVLGLGAEIGLQATSRRAPFRDVAHFIDSHSRPGDPVIQAFFIPAGGPLGKVISINLSHPRPIATNAKESQEAWAAGRAGHDVFVTLDLPGVLSSTKHLPVRNGPGSAFVRIAEQRYVGLSTVIVGEYRYAGGAGRG